MADFERENTAHRSLIACTNCARLKNKCDKQIPCGPCDVKQIVCQPRWSRRSDSSARNQAKKQETQQRRVSRQQNTAPSAGKDSSTASVNDKGSLEGSKIISQHTLSPEIHDSWDHGLFANVADFSNEMDPPTTLTTTSFPDPNAFLLNPIDFDTVNPLIGAGMSAAAVDRSVADFDYFNVDSLRQQNAAIDFAAPQAGQDTIMQDTGVPLSSEPLSSIFSDAVPDRFNREFTNSANVMPARNRSLESFTCHSSGSMYSSVPYPQSTPASSVSSPRLRASSLSKHGSVKMQSPRINSASVNHCNFYNEDVMVWVQDMWPGFRCSPPMGAVSSIKTAEIHLQGLTVMLRNLDFWESWTMPKNDIEPDLQSHIKTEPMLDQTRDKLSSILQTMLQKAFDAHKLTLGPSMSEVMAETSDAGDCYGSILPPASILEHFLRCYALRIEQFYPSICEGRITPNVLMQSKNPWMPALLLLLMIAFGAIGSFAQGAQHLTSGLTEACRITMLQNTEKNVDSRSNPLVLRCALLLTMLTAWSGDKWHMDAAISQRGTYVAMLTQSGLMNYREISFSSSDCRQHPEEAWQVWKDQECRNRVVYSWVLVDFEMSLFCDVASLVPICDMNVAVPDSEDMWQATNANDWMLALERNYAHPIYTPMPSLSELFRKFTEAQGAAFVQPTPLQLRLLLHPIQAMIRHVRQYLGCIGSGGKGRKVSRTTTGSAMRGQLEEVQTLLLQWYRISRSTIASGTTLCARTSVTMMLYHLVSLNTVTCFESIECMAREETSSASFTWLLLHCIDDAEEAFFHSGQVLRLMSLLPEQVRPLWWPAAVYRVALITATCSMAQARGGFPIREAIAVSDLSTNPILINHALPEDHGVERYRKYREGEPSILAKNGTVLSLKRPTNILRHCIDILNEDLIGPFAIGVRNRLRRLADRWTDGCSVE